MNIEFKDKALEDLYTTGKTKDHKFKRGSSAFLVGRTDFCRS